MMKILSSMLISFLTIFMLSCGGGDSLDIQGDQEAKLMAEDMIEALGGRKNWNKIESVYIRTLGRDMETGDAYVFEEWINLSEPRFMNRRVRGEINHFSIVNKNDGWSVQNDNVSLMPPGSVTNYLKWYDNFFMRKVKMLALGGEGLEVKNSGDRAFDMFRNGEFAAGFQLNEDNLPEKYVTKISEGRFSIINIKKWGEYKGFSYPLLVTGEEMGSLYQTDYWDAGMLDAESAFNITFDPYEIAQNYQ